MKSARSRARELAHGVSADAYKQRAFVRSLLLVENLAEQLGGRYSDLLRRLSDSAADGHSLVDAVASREGRLLADAQLRHYDANIRRHEAQIGAHRPDFRLTYFQWLAALFVEMTLDTIKSGPDGWLRSLEARRQSFAPFLSPYRPEDLRKLACFMATGSGKTLLLHLNLLQFLDYGLFEPDNILLLTPNEGLSDQHRGELERSGLDGLGVRIIEITKLYVDDLGSRRPRKGASLPTSQFEGPNLLLVDEGHKGGGTATDTRGEREWRAIREALAAGSTPENRGFVFEYSATFAQMAAASGNEELYDEYAKCVVADFGYARFHGDGYGKDFRILNAKARDGTDLTLSAGLLTFYRQVRAADEHPALLAEYQLASPLWVALGKSVTAANSDVAILLAFLDRAASDTAWLAEQLDRVRRDVALTQGALEGDPLDFGALKGVDANQLAVDAQSRLFGGTGRLRLHLVSDNEIGLRSTAAADDRYCALVRVGEARKFVKQAQDSGALDVGEDDRLAGSLFERIESDTHLRFLIGAKMFVEGWSSWRVSAMALMNVGRGAGSEIVQMFGRGVRLRGRGMRLKRAGAGAPEAVRLLETLNVFGVRADYLQTFVETLRHEGVARVVHYWPLREYTPPVDSLGLMTLEGDDVPFEGVVLPDPKRDAARIVLDGGLSLVVGMAGAAAVGTASRKQYSVAGWLDGAAAYAEALDWRRNSPSDRVVVSPQIIDALMAESIVEAPAGEFDAEDEQTVRRKQTLAAQCVRRALENACNQLRREFYAKRMRPAPLRVADNPNFPRQEVNGQSMLAVRIEAQATEDLVAELRARIEEMQRGGVLSAETAGRMLAALNEGAGVGNVSERVQELLKLATAESADDGTAPLPRMYFDRHLYSPLFVAQPFVNRNGQLALFGSTESGVRLNPPPLNEGEAQFVHDLREFWMQGCRAAEWQDVEIYLLRNQARTGVGFFTGAGFYPDFLLWMKRGRRQVLCFVEPKGLGRDWPRDKIKLLRSLADQCHKNLPLRGITITPTPLPDIQRLQPEATVESLAADRILLQDRERVYVATLLADLAALLR
jgi:superfamily II DNA or RNA helicase